MSWSLGEIRALAIKAARGAGMPWGMAEEAGFASHWLLQQGLPGTELLATLLTLHDKTDAATTLLAQISAEDYRSILIADQTHASTEFTTQLINLAGKRAICPLLLGTMISDGLLSQTCPPGLQLRVPQAGLLLPFLNQLNSHSKRSLTIRLTAESTHPDPLAADLFIQSNPAGKTKLLAHAANADLSREQTIDILSTDNVLCHWMLEADNTESPTIAGQLPVQLNQAAARVPDSATDSIHQLTRLAARTYAPETDESREKGAGAGTSDND